MFQKKRLDFHFYDVFRKLTSYSIRPYFKNETGFPPLITIKNYMI